MTPAPADTGTNHADAPTVVLAGAGRMGGALLDAWLDGGVSAGRLAVVEPHADPALAERLGRLGIALNRPAQVAASVLVLAIKPQMLDEAAPGLAPYTAAGTLVLSVVAGKTVADLRRAFPEAGSVARAMPNTPAAIRRGITGVAPDARVTPAQRETIQVLLGAVGAVEWLDHEGLIDAVTAVSGSGPAYVFLLAECLATAAEAVGLPADLAMRFARATVEGAGALMAARPENAPDRLRRDVTSPGGTTAAALDALMRDGALATLMTEAVMAAKRRAGELAG